MILKYRNLLIKMILKPYNNIMVLAKTTGFGLTYGQIITLVALVSSVLYGVIDVNIKVAKVEKDVLNLDIKYNIQIENLEKGRLLNAYNIEEGRKENNQAHQMIMNKLDQIFPQYKLNP
jgi:hypothetical protein